MSFLALMCSFYFEFDPPVSLTVGEDVEDADDDEKLFVQIVITKHQLSRL